MNGNKKLIKELKLIQVPNRFDRNNIKDPCLCCHFSDSMCHVVFLSWSELVQVFYHLFKNWCRFFNRLFKNWCRFFNRLFKNWCNFLLPSLGIRRPSVVRHKLSHLNLLLWNPWTELNQTWEGWSLGGSLSKLCLTDLPSFQDGCCY
jgi:hypothetical protein